MGRIRRANGRGVLFHMLLVRATLGAGVGPQKPTPLVSAEGEGVPCLDTNAITPAAANDANAVYAMWLAAAENTAGMNTLYGRAPVADACSSDLSSLGGTDQQGKHVCNAATLLAGDECVVVSIGSSLSQWQFERDVFEQSSCTVHTFDCTGSSRGLAVPEDISSRVMLHEVCIHAPQIQVRSSSISTPSDRDALDLI